MGSVRHIGGEVPREAGTRGPAASRAREKLMTAIARVAATLNAEHNPDKALELICREARALFAAHTVVLWEPRGDHLVVTSALGGLDPLIRGYRVPIDDPHVLACRCFRERRPILQNDLLRRGGNPLMVEFGPAVAILCVPLIHREQVLGAISLRDCENPRRYTRADIDAASVFADLAAVAIANARLQEEAERRAQEAAVLSRISRIVTSGRDVRETSESFARELRNLIFFHRVAITLLEGAEHFRIVLAAGLDAEGLNPGDIRPLAGSGVEWVVRHRRPHVIYDLELEQTFPSDEMYAKSRMRSVVRVPLIERGEPLGAMTLVSATPGAYGSRDVELLEQVAGQIAGVFANAQMVEIERGLLARLSALHRVTDAALSTLDLDSLLDALLERCIEIVGADSGMVLLLDEAGEELSIRGARWMAEEKPWEFTRRLGVEISGKVAQDGRPRLVAEVDDEDLDDTVATRQRGVHSLLAVPLKARGRTIGVFRLESRRPNHFDRHHLQLMEVVAERMALAIDNARLLQEARERAANEALIHRIASAIGSSLNLDQVMNTAVRELQAATGCSRCAVALAPQRAGGFWSLWEARAEGIPPVGDLSLPWRDDPLVRTKMMSREPTVLEDLEKEPLPKTLRLLARNAGVRSVLGASLFRDDEPIGALELYQLHQPRRWTKREVDLVRAMATQLSLAVENARLYGETDERLRARVRELGSLLRLSRAVSEQLSLDVVIERAVEEGLRALNADCYSITTVDWHRRTLTVRAIQQLVGSIPEWVGMEVPLDSLPHSVRAMAEREPVVVGPDHPSTSPAELSFLEKLGLAVAVIVPLAVGDRAIGTACLGRKGDRPGFSEEEIALARAMAGQVAVAMENARLFQEVQSQKARTEAIVGSMSEGVYATDRDGRITSVNPWLEAMVGRRAEEMVGRLCRKVLLHTDEEGNPCCDAGCPLSVALREGKVPEPTLVFTPTAWGDRLPTILSVAPIRDDLRAIIGGVAVLRDVGRDWQMDKLKSNIISVVSHEFRTPLTSIIGFSELLLTRDQSAEERRSCAEHIYNEGLKLETLVNDFLDVSRLDAGRVALSPEPLEPALVLEKSVDCVRARAGERRLMVEVEEGLPRVQADPGRLGQVMENLLSNAIKYSPDGSNIVLRARRGWEDGLDHFHIGEGNARPWVLFTVEDQGYGIPSDQLTDIFTPFHRVEGALTRRIRGTGLGLSIVKSLVELHGGRVWVESEVGVGSRFHVALQAAGD